jgi:hypothetical protein
MNYRRFAAGPGSQPRVSRRINCACSCGLVSTPRPGRQVECGQPLGQGLAVASVFPAQRQDQAGRRRIVDGGVEALRHHARQGLFPRRAPAIGIGEIRPCDLEQSNHGGSGPVPVTAAHVVQSLRQVGVIRQIRPARNVPGHVQQLRQFRGPFRQNARALLASSLPAEPNTGSSRSSANADSSKSVQAGQLLLVPRQPAGLPVLQQRPPTLLDVFADFVQRQTEPLRQGS